MVSNKSVGASVSALLAQYGVDTIFGIPGVHNVELFRDTSTLNINVILPRHEQGAAFMADGFARATGKPGVCFSITGPGVTNSLTPLGQAYSDSVPVILISSSLPRRDDGKDHGSLHEMKDQEAAASTVVGLCMTADCESDIEEFCARAFSMFGTLRPRPAYLQIPIDLLDRPADRGLSIREVPPPPTASADILEKASARLANSRRTVIVAGGGAIGAEAEVLQLALRLNAAVVTTVAGKGVVSEDNSRSIGAALRQESTHTFLRSAEVVLVIGSELSRREYWCDPLPFQGTVIRIDIDSMALSGFGKAQFPILSDARTAVDGLLSYLPEDVPGISNEEIAEVRAAAKSEICSQEPAYARFIQAMRAALPRNAIVATDMTMPAYFGSQIYQAFESRSWLGPHGFGTLGYALPAGIGAKIGAPDRPVAVLVGDYGFQYTMQELAVAVQYSLPMPIVIWNNESLLAIEEEMVKRQISPIAVRCHNPDFCRLAEAMGASSACPQSYDELEKAIEAALGHDRPTVIEVKSNAIAN